MPLILAFALCLPESARAQYVRAETDGDKTRGEDIQTVLLHPPIDAQEGFLQCSEHSVGQLPLVGGKFGQDCQVAGTVEASGRRITSLHRGQGLENEDWFSWEKPVLAPFDGVVVSVDSSSQTPNPPGKALEDSQTGRITFMRAEDSVRVEYAHVRNLRVAPGDRVTAGQVVAQVGNNGSSFSPHVHLGAYRGRTPFQIRFDLKALGCLRGHVAEAECE